MIQKSLNIGHSKVTLKYINHCYLCCHGNEHPSISPNTFAHKHDNERTCFCKEKGCRFQLFLNNTVFACKSGGVFFKKNVLYLVCSLFILRINFSKSFFNIDG